MGTWKIRGTSTVIACHRLGTAALASAIALALFMPVTAGARSGAVGQSARTSVSAVVTRGSAPAPVSGSLKTSGRETGCCA